MSEPGPAREPSPQPPRTGPISKKRNISLGQILGGILLVLVVVFIVENNDDVHIRLIAGPKVTAPISVALLIAAVLGALIAALLRYRRQRRKNRS